MARPSAAAAALLFLLSLLAVVAHCRPIEPQSATDDAEPAAAAADDENGPPNPTLPAEEALHGFLRLPSHRLPRRHHRPCRHGPFFHRHHLWWARHHGAFFGDDDAPAPRRFHFRHRRHGDDDEALIHLPAAAALPFPAFEAANREAAGAEEEVKAVAEPDPDRSLPDGEAFADADGAHEAAEVVAHRHEMLRRWLRFHHRHGMRLRHHRDDEHEREEAEDEAEGLKRFHHHHHHHDEDEDDEEKRAMRKRFRRGERDDGDDEEDEEVEEMVRRFRKAIMRRRQFGHGRRRFHGHRHAEKADAQEEEGGVVAWIKGLVNRF